MESNGKAGDRVVTSAGDPVGQLARIVLNPKGSVAYAVLRCDNDAVIELPRSTLRFDPTRDRFVLGSG